MHQKPTQNYASSVLRLAATPNIAYSYTPVYAHAVRNDASNSGMIIRIHINQQCGMHNNLLPHICDSFENISPTH